MQFGTVLMPLFGVEFSTGLLTKLEQIRYLGVSFHVNDLGDIATCAHVVNSLRVGETLAAMAMQEDLPLFKVESMRIHPTFDFAVGRVARKRYLPLAIYGGREVSLGTDVMSYGFTYSGIVAGKHVMIPRLFKGSVVRVDRSPVVPSARSTCELSFPSHHGFSGTPVLTNTAKVRLAGMLFGNYESSITLHRQSKTADDGTMFSEEIHKVVELGLAHTAFDVRCFLRDLGVERVALDTPEGDDLE